MQRDDVIARLKRAESALRKSGVEALYLFGSYRRDEAHDDLDVDVFVDPRSADDFGFLRFMQAYETIRQAVGEGVEVGYSTAKASRLTFARRSSKRPPGSFESVIA
jgi:uncharacterized protein